MNAWWRHTQIGKNMFLWWQIMAGVEIALGQLTLQEQMLDDYDVVWYSVSQEYTI